MDAHKSRHYITKSMMCETLGMLEGEMLSKWPETLIGGMSEFEYESISHALQTMSILADTLGAQMHQWGYAHSGVECDTQAFVSTMGEISKWALCTCQKVIAMKKSGEGSICLGQEIDQVRCELKKIHNLLRMLPE